jgi:hypothetical protein
MINEIIENYPDQEILKADGYDDCVLGCDFSSDGTIRLIYSVDAIIKKLVSEDNMDVEDAMEYFEFNMRGSYVGKLTPIWCQDDYYERNENPWRVYDKDVRSVENNPQQSGKFEVYREGCQKQQYAQWNGTGWAYDNNDITHWREIIPPIIS